MTETLEKIDTVLAGLEAADDIYQIATYAKMPIAIERGSGAFVWTTDGSKYLDLYGGHAVCATGHSHPAVVRAITEQAKEIIFYSNLVYSDIRTKVAEALCTRAPKFDMKAFFCNSGTEANENAMRIARLVTGREKIVSFGGGFHGRTADAISATFLGKYRTIGKPNVPGHIEAKFGDADGLRSVIDADTAAVIVEPIQSMAGVREASPEFFIELRNVCDSVGALLIFDEVQTGVGRTGQWFFSGSEHAGVVVPDIITLAKSLGSGVPVGACLVDGTTANAVKVNDLGTTFGGGMLAMAAVMGTIEAIETDSMLVNAKRVEVAIRAALEGKRGIKGVRGKGCLLGIEFETACAPIHAGLLERKIITGTSSDPNVLRLLPPMNVDASMIADVISDALDEIEH